MTTQVHDTGEEAFIRDFFVETLTKPASITVGLYHDGEVSGDTTNGDNLADGSDLININTEPGGASYARQSLSFGTTDMTAQDNGADWEVAFVDMTFDTSDSTQDVDAYFVVINFQSSDTGDTAASDHLLFTGNLDKLYNLNNYSSVTLTGSGLIQQ